MSLTGTPFFALTVLFAVVSTVLLLVLWNRLRGPLAVRLAGRVGLALLSQAAAVLCVMVWVNNTQGPFYESWSDLFGTGGSAQVALPGGVQARGIGGTRPTAAERLSFTRQAGGVLKTVAVGPRSGIKAELLVWLPPEYREPGYAHRSFPVVELLPGFPGAPSTWFGSMHGPQVLERLVAERKAGPAILVAPQMNVLGHTDPGCADVPGTAATATWLGRDVPALVKANFRAQHPARDWGVMGYSAGGYCAVNLAVHYPGTFHSAVSLSGYNAPIAGPVLADPVLAAENNPLLVLRRARRQPDVTLLMTGTDQDGGTVRDAYAIMRAARPPARVLPLIAPKGGHNTGVWHSMLPAAFTWLARQT
ncbi:alpha/beta hydrolase [Phaeacidiphilus oryzae]|uniref:alpha/beta hydrolase n=1 Tax=Phaeacidiphilus oryzae TaxID=348818 RepID=UPI00069052DF|nr:alpha/beta hydrolase-fold protein [Phaeacidiphilus oryzae]